METVILYIGFGIFIFGGICFLISAFRTSILWGLAVLLIAPVSLFYLIVHWENAKEAFKLQILGLLIIAGVLFLSSGSTLSGSIGASLPSISWSSSNNVASNQRFRCDGRQYCSQMHSRAEAEYFLFNCPNPKMDGDRDGIPCENDSRF